MYMLGKFGKELPSLNSLSLSSSTCAASLSLNFQFTNREVKESSCFSNPIDGPDSQYPKADTANVDGSLQLTARYNNKLM